ncbi:MAG: DUF4198 domain-containing protein [Pseudomonadota bacterium]
MWIAPERFSLPSGAVARADIKNGEKFSGAALYYNPEGAVRLERHSDDTRVTLDGRLGDTPAITTKPLSDGLHVLVYQSKPTDIYYGEFEKFARFASQKGFVDIAARHDARNIPRDGFREVYARFAKALVLVGDRVSDAVDGPVGLETEIVALDPIGALGQADNDGLSQSDDLTFRVKVLYREKPRVNAQVEVFAKAQDGQVVASKVMTDAEGIAIIPVRRGVRYLLDAVVLRRPDAARAETFRAVWETLWASLTFEVPAVAR